MSTESRLQVTEKSSKQLSTWINLQALQTAWKIESYMDEEDENPETYLRRPDVVLQMPGRVPSLHVCLFTKVGRGLDHGRSTRTIVIPLDKFLFF